jgi:opacity protein-like surface antigen
MWKRAAIAAMAVVAAGLGVQAADLSPEDLIKAVDKMTPEQAHQVKRELDSKSRQTRSYAWLSQFSVEFAGVWERFDKYGIENERFSADKPDLEKSMGGALALQWKPLDYLGLGVEYGFYAGSDKDLSNGSYSSAKLLGSHTAARIRLEFLKQRYVLAWADASVGMGSVAIETVDTPRGQATTLREYDADYWFATPAVGLAFRCTEGFSIFGQAGYRFCEKVDLKQGGSKLSDRELDGSGVELRLGVGFNI